VLIGRPPSVATTTAPQVLQLAECCLGVLGSSTYARGQAVLAKERTLLAVTQDGWTAAAAGPTH